jgi:hypothetical protein
VLPFWRLENNTILIKHKEKHTRAIIISCPAKLPPLLTAPKQAETFQNLDTKLETFLENRRTQEIQALAENFETTHQSYVTRKAKLQQEIANLGRERQTARLRNKTNTS